MIICTLENEVSLIFFFFLWKVVIKSNMYINTHRISVPHTNFQKNFCSIMKIINNLMGCLILISAAVYIKS